MKLYTAWHAAVTPLQVRTRPTLQHGSGMENQRRNSESFRTRCSANECMCGRAHVCVTVNTSISTGSKLDNSVKLSQPIRSVSWYTLPSTVTTVTSESENN